MSGTNYKTEIINDRRSMGIIAHLLEFRTRLIYCLLMLMSVFAVSFYFAQEVYYYLAIPLLNRLLPEGGLIAINVMAPVFVPIKLAFYFSLFVTIPFIIYQIWAFIAPALYQRERKFAVPILVLSVGLFYSGMAFTYFIVLPMLLGFLTKMVPVGVSYLPDISAYLDFVLKLFIVFGLAFEVPIVSFLCVATGVFTIAQLSRQRPFVIIAAFIIGMLVTPPDVISQILFAGVFWVLFEVGILCARILPATRATVDDKL